MYILRSNSVCTTLAKRNHSRHLPGKSMQPFSHCQVEKFQSEVWNVKLKKKKKNQAGKLALSLRKSIPQKLYLFRALFLHLIFNSTFYFILRMLSSFWAENFPSRSQIAHLPPEKNSFTIWFERIWKWNFPQWYWLGKVYISRYITLNNYEC